MTSLRIVHTPVRSFPHIGGVELHVHHLANQLISQAHHVTVIAAQSKQKHLQETQYIRKLLPWSFKVTNTEITTSLPSTLHQIDFDLIHTHIPTPWTSDWSMLIGTIKKKKKVLTIHNDMNKTGFWAYWLTRFYVHTAMKLALFLADKIIIVNEDWEKSFSFTRNILKPFKEKIVYIPNAVDTSLFQSKTLKIPQRILCVSVLDKYHDFKGIPYLLKAFQTILHSFPDATLHIVGEGELKKVYQEETKALEIDHATQFSGKASQEELVQYYSESTVFVLPSTDTEGFGLVLLEALACETPVITTPVAGVVKDIQSHQCGTIIKEKSDSEIAHAIEEYFTNPQRVKEHGRKGRTLVQKKYSWDQVAKKTVALYQSIV